MAALTQLSDAEIHSLAHAYGLGEVTAWGEVSGGTINSNYWIEATFRRWFLRVNEGKSEDDVRWEAALVEQLAAVGVPTPALVRTWGGALLRHHRGRWVSVFPWIAGQHREASQVSPGDAAAVGQALGQLHRAGLPLAGRFSRPGIYTTAHMAQRYRQLIDTPASAGDPVLAPALAAVGDELGYLAERAELRAQAPRGVIHGDLFRDNVLFDGDQLVALIDFEQASAGAWVYDLAVCLNAWCFDDGEGGAPVLDPARVQAMLEGYQGQRRLEPVERQLLPVEVRAAAMRFTVTRITDVYLPGADMPGKDFRRYLARLQRWRQGGGELLAASLG